MTKGIITVVILCAINTGYYGFSEYMRGGSCYDGFTLGAIASGVSAVMGIVVSLVLIKINW